MSDKANSSSNAKTVLQILLQDPGNLDDLGHPVTWLVLHVQLADILEKVAAHNSRPASEVIDEFIEEMTLNSKVPAETAEGCDVRVEFNCARCGSPLGVDSCPGCGLKYKDDQSRPDWGVPLSRRMIEFLEKEGYFFEADPWFVLTEERLLWEAEQSN